MGLLDRLRAGLARTTEQLVSRLGEVVRRAESPERRGQAVDVETLDALEEALVAADVGVAAAARIIGAVRARQDATPLRALVEREILDIFTAADRTAVRPGDSAAPGPRVLLVVGVNGTGKTTTVGKLANLFRSEGCQPLICAADTFRAAAAEQLDVWAGRAGVEIVRAREGADPAAVVFDAMVAGKTRHRDPVIVDTAGRLHTRANLMGELAKIRRVAAREIEGAPHEVLLVLDATVGQNGLVQAREFLGAAGVTGIVLAKLDGTAKGGIAVAIAHDLGIPLRYVGVGESIDDLLPFSPRDYVTALFEDQWERAPRSGPTSPVRGGRPPSAAG